MSVNPEMKVGIIGFGEMGKRHALEYHHATQGKMDFVAVVEPEESRYEEGCAWYGKRPRRYTSVKEMLAAEKLAGLHFYNMMQGKAEPFTTVEDAFAAEMVGIGAMKSSKEHCQIDLEKDIVPKDLLAAFRKAY